MVLAPTYPMLRDATLRTFLDLAHRGNILRSFNRAEMRATLGGNRTVLFRSADNPDRLRGPNLGWFWMDEAAMCTAEVWLIMLGRLREEPGIAWGTTTPRGKDWVYKTFVDTEDSDYHHVRGQQSHQHVLRLLCPVPERAYDSEFAKQEIEGEFLDDTLGQPILDWWVDRLPELRRPNEPGGPRWISTDLGEGGGRDSSVSLVGDDLGILHGEESPWVDSPGRHHQ